jgi:hypothetical protein
VRLAPASLRAAVHSTFGALWLLGTAAFVLQHFYRTPTEFGPAVNPWQPRVIALHGMLAVLGTFLFGWIAGGHVAVAWRRAADRPVGVVLTVLLALLIVTGFASFFLVEDAWRASDAAVHEYLGLALLLPWLAHLTWSRGRAYR